MTARGITQILNVTDLAESFRWFEAFGWSKLWDWGDPPGFGAVGSGVCEIFLCQDGQGGRSRLPDGERSTDSETSDGNRGVWMSLWVDDVDAVHRRCRDRDIEVIAPPEDMPWQVREMWVRHPDGHVFRVSRGLEHEDPRSPDAPPLPIDRVDVPVRLEARLAAVLTDLAAHKGMFVSECLEETLLHSFEPSGGGVASPHRPEDFDAIEALKRKHGLDYGTHASYRFLEGESPED
ncbi:MAG: bleomycin resistance family protein [Gemmatimonadetes bacterium]|nr:bleomycin resistance family protein [Gemmatimonadota bacterium]